MDEINQHAASDDDNSDDQAHPHFAEGLQSPLNPDGQDQLRRYENTLVFASNGQVHEEPPFTQEASTDGGEIINI